jgi:hypothetical protein
VEVEVKVEPKLTQSQVKSTDGVTVSVPGVDHVGTEAVVTHKGAASLQLRDVVVVGREERVILMGEVKALHLDWRARFLVMLWRLVAPRGREYASNLDCYPLDDEPTDGEPRATQATDVGWLRYTAPAMLRSLVDGFILQRSQAGGQRGMRLTRLQAAEWLKELIPRALDDPLASFLEHNDPASRKALDTAFNGHGGQCSDAILSSATLVLSTVSVCGREQMQQLLKTRTSAIVCDEAAMVPRSIFSILLTGNARFVLQVGDHKQLGAVVKSRAGREHSYSRSLFQDHMELGMSQSMLLVQRRSVGDIVAFNNAQFYDGKLTHDVKHREVVNAAVNSQLPPLTAWLSEKGPEDDEGNSFNNKLQSQICLKLLEKLAHLCAGLNAVVLTFYEHQRSAFLKNLESFKNQYTDSPLNKGLYKSIDAKTVHQFQGNEANVVFLLTSRCNANRDPGFCSDECLFNVATTRAQSALLVIGSEDTLSSCGVWKAYFTHCRADKTGNVRVTDLDLLASSNGTSASSADGTTGNARRAVPDPPTSSTLPDATTSAADPNPGASSTATSATGADRAAPGTPFWNALTAAAVAVVVKHVPGKTHTKSAKSAALSMAKPNRHWTASTLGDVSSSRKRTRSDDSRQTGTSEHAAGDRHSVDCAGLTSSSAVGPWDNYGGSGAGGRYSPGRAGGDSNLSSGGPQGYPRGGERGNGRYGAPNRYRGDAVEWMPVYPEPRRYSPGRAGGPRGGERGNGRYGAPNRYRGDAVEWMPVYPEPRRYSPGRAGGPRGGERGNGRYGAPNRYHGDAVEWMPENAGLGGCGGRGVDSAGEPRNYGGARGEDHPDGPQFGHRVYGSGGH